MKLINPIMAWWRVRSERRKDELLDEIMESCEMVHDSSWKPRQKGVAADSDIGVVIDDPLPSVRD